MHILKTNTITGSVIVYIIIFLFINKPSYSQPDIGSLDSANIVYDSISHVYGKDPLLYNGILYSSVYPETVIGHQYFLSNEFSKGEITLRGVTFTNLDLNLDTYKQELLLKYSNSNNTSEVIMISQAWLENFSIGKLKFKYFNFPKLSKHIFQVLGNDSIMILYYWKKDLKPDNVNGSKNLVFTQKKELSILIDSKAIRFYNNRSFLHLFTTEKQIAIKKYLRFNKIKVKSASDESMEKLINYCGKL